MITVYDTTTGEIIKSLIGPKDLVKSQVPDGASFVEGRVNGKRFKIVNGEIVAKEPVQEDNAASILLLRQQLLQKTDWTQLPDVPESTRLAYVEYRQALRDITEQDGFPDNVIWPNYP